MKRLVLRERKSAIAIVCISSALTSDKVASSCDAAAGAGAICEPNPDSESSVRKSAVLVDVDYLNLTTLKERGKREKGSRNLGSRRERLRLAIFTCLLLLSLIGGVGCELFFGLSL